MKTKAICSTTRAACRKCGAVFEAPDEFADLVQQGAVDCALFDAAWAQALAAVSVTA